jgi:capsular polysaccharide transport system permease protein
MPDLPPLPHPPLDDAGTRRHVTQVPPDRPEGPGPLGLSLPRFPVEPARRRGIRWSFLLMVVVPTLLGLVYYTQVAAPQYVTTAVVALRIGEDQRDGGGGPSTLVGALGPSSAGAPVTQSYGIVEYIRSLPAMQDVAREGLDLRAILASDRADPLTRVPPDASPEMLLAAWRSRVSAQFELTRGVVTLRTRAFTPDESLAMAEAVLAASERLANEMSQRMTSDSLRAAEVQVAAAEQRFTAALADLQGFRATSGVLDPGRAASSGLAIEMQLRQELASADAQAEGLRAAGGQGSPMLAAALARARALRAQLMDGESRASRSAGERNDTSWAEVLARNDALTSALRVAEQHFTQALALLQTARAEAARQRSYLLTYVRPVLASQPNYPDRWLSMLIVAGCALLVWSLLSLMFHAILDRT